MWWWYLYNFDLMPVELAAVSEGALKAGYQFELLAHGTYKRVPLPFI